MSAIFSRSILLTDETFIALQPTLIKLFGRSAAQVLAVLHSWLQRSKNLIDGVYWVYNTYAQWTAKIPGLSIRTLQRVMTALERLGIVHSDRKEAHQWYQRKWYTIDYDRLRVLISSNPPTCLDPCRQNGEFINKDPFIENLKTTNTSVTAFIPVEPPTHPVPETEIEIDNGVTGFQPDHTGNDLNLENPEIRTIQDPQPHPQIKPKLKPKQTLNSLPQTITPPPPAEIPAEIEAAIVQTIAPVPLHRNLRKQVLQAQIHVIQDAIALVNQQKASGTVKNPAGLLVKAIQHQWKPNQPSSSPPPLPEDFNEWFDLARQSGLAIASSLIDGVLCVCTSAQKWEPYEDFRSAFSLPWLRRSLQGQGLPPPS
jgi:hypothetical protein